MTRRRPHGPTGNGRMLRKEGFKIEGRVGILQRISTGWSSGSRSLFKLACTQLEEDREKILLSDSKPNLGGTPSIKRHLS